MMTPRLRFPEFTAEWQVKKLGDIVEFGRGGVLSKNELNDSGKYSAVHYGQLFTQYNEIIDKVTSKTNVNTGKLSEVGDILMPTSDVTPQGLAKASVINEDGVMLGGDINVLKPNSFMSSSFLSYVINSQKKKVMRLVSGTTIRHVYASEVSKALYSFPSKAEQEKIADFLTAVDERIKLSEQKLEQLQKYKRGVMQKIFSQQIRFKDENGNNYPDWEEKKLGEILEFLRTNSSPRAELSTTGDVMNIHYGDIHTKLGAHFDASKQKLSYLKIAGNSEFVKVGDLIIADASEDRLDVGKSVEVIDTNGFNIVSGLHTFLARPKMLALGFAGYLMQSVRVRRQLWRIATGASVLGISKSELSKLTINLPAIEEQGKIASFLAVLDEKITTEQVKLTASRQFKKGLLQRMFV